MFQRSSYRLYRWPEIRPKHRQSWSATYVLALLISLPWLFNPMSVWASEVLGGLSEAQLADISQQCIPLQFTQGADAYRQCLRQKLVQIQPSNERDNAAYANLPVDEQFAIQRACSNERSTSSSEYVSCTRDQHDQMQQEPEPALSVISVDEQYVLAKQCFQSQTSSGARAYRKCINTALESLSTLPKVNFTTRSNIERNNIQLECSLSTDNVATYRKCLLNASGIAFEQAITSAILVNPDENNRKEIIDTTSGQPTKNRSEPERAEQGSELPAELLEVEEPGPLLDTTGTFSAETDTLPSLSTSTDFTQTIRKFKITSLELFDKSKAKLATLNPEHWIALATLFSISLLFLVVRSARKAKDRQSPAIASRPNLGPATRRVAVVPSVKPVTESQAYRDELPARETNKESHANSISSSRLPVVQPTPASHMSFLKWLKNFQPNQQQEYAIEFLIYWMAYADNRFDPTLRKRVFEMKNPDIPNLIKRWVFKKDANALADAIDFLQSHTSIEQRKQIINLLMALLVNEKALTPAQNNLLRFFADAFGIGKIGLHEQFNRAYGQLMPEIPRPDKIVWWDQITSEQKLRWDARAVARQPHIIRCRIALGQPLRGELKPESVDKSLNLAMSRCAAEQVNMLGERELSLMASKRKKFEMAGNTLLELAT